MERFERDHINRLMTLTSDYIKRLLLYSISLQKTRPGRDYFWVTNVKIMTEIIF